jgi:hypothetical protein
MKIVAHSLSLLCTLPGLLFATFALSIDHLSSQQGLLTILGALLKFGALLPIGLIVLVVVFAVLTVFAFLPRFCLTAACGVATLAAGPILLLLWRGELRHFPSDGVVIWVPNAIALAISVWLASRAIGVEPRGPSPDQPQR